MVHHLGVVHQQHVVAIQAEHAIVQPGRQAV
jgi:hypothetical protein